MTSDDLSPLPPSPLLCTKISQTFNDLFSAWPNVHSCFKAQSVIRECVYAVFGVLELQYSGAFRKVQEGKRGIFGEGTARFCADKR